MSAAAATADAVTFTLFGQLPLDAIAMLCDAEGTCMTPSQALGATSRLVTQDAPFAVVPSDRFALLEDIAEGYSAGEFEAEALSAIGAHLYVSRSDVCEICHCCTIAQSEAQSEGAATRDTTFSASIVPDGYIVLDLRN